MRVIAGRFRGRELRTVRGLSVRPATGRVRQTVFDTLTARVDLSGAAVLDLFAGSGSLGIEALSRGAARAVFVESDPAAVRVIEENLLALGCGDSAAVVSADGMTFLEQSRERFTLAFADPPYAFPGTPRIPETVFRGPLLAPDGWLLIEHAADLRFADAPLYRVGPEKRFGRSIVTFFQHAQHTRTEAETP